MNMPLFQKKVPALQHGRGSLPVGLLMKGLDLPHLTALEFPDFFPLFQITVTRLRGRRFDPLK